MEKFIEKFVKAYGHAPAAAASAPGRLEILGNHTDYNEGLVLSCAVAQHTKFALRPIPGTLCRVKDFRDEMDVTFDLASPNAAPARDGSRYIKGVALELAKRGVEVGAFECAIESTIPLSAGMSSSAALETAAGLGIGKVFGADFDRVTWARIGQGVENDYLGLKTGLLDQFSSLFGKKDAMILSDFRTVEVLRTVPLPAGYAIVVINSMKKHNLVDSEYNTRRADCEHAAKVLSSRISGVRTLRDVTPEMLEANRSALELREYRRAAHVVWEVARVKKGVELLESGDVAGFGALWFDSHESSRVNFENSTPELDYLVELAKSVPGCLGARLSGGGFGGITIHLVKAEAAAEYAERVCAGYLARTGIQTRSLICSIGDGAQVCACPSAK